MHPFVNDIKNLLLDTLFPIECLNCQKEGLFLCLNCQQQLQTIKYQRCTTCDKPSLAGLTHNKCKTSRSPQALISVFDYRDPLLAQAIIWGKYKFLPNAYKILGQLMAKYLEKNNYTWLFNNAVLCPIPLSKQRLRWRGFNQTEILAQELGKHFSVPVEPLLQRVKNTKTQKDLSKAQRVANMAASFASTAAPSGQSIILIDDVITTGATLREAAKSLKAAGAKQILFLTLARD